MPLTPNLWRQISKESAGPAWMSDTEAMNVPGGCIVRSTQTTETGSPSESMVFLPDVQVYLDLKANFFRLCHGTPKRTDDE